MSFIFINFKGSEENGGRITMTKIPETSQSGVVTSNPFPTDARLMDGNTTRDGKLELFYEGRWRGVCNNYIKYVIKLYMYVLLKMADILNSLYNKAYIKTFCYMSKKAVNTT